MHMCLCWLYGIYLRENVVVGYMDITIHPHAMPGMIDKVFFEGWSLRKTCHGPIFTRKL